MANFFDEPEEQPQGGNFFEEAPQAESPHTDQTLASTIKESEKEPEGDFWFGFGQGFRKPFDNINTWIDKGVESLGFDPEKTFQSIGLDSTKNAINRNNQYVAEQAEKGRAPGDWGKFTGNIAATAPLAAITKNPWALGAGSGALLTDDPLDPTGVAFDTAFGAATGKVGDAVGKAAVRSISPKIDDALNAVGLGRGKKIEGLPSDVKPSVAQRAANYVEDIGGGAEKSAQTLSQYEKATKPILSSEAFGKRGIRGLSVLARRAGTTGDDLEAIVADRANNMPSRVIDDVTESTGISPEAAQGDIDAVVELWKEQAAPLYKKAYEAPIPVTDNLREIATRPTVRSSMKTAVKIIRDAGEDPRDYGFIIRHDGEVMVPGTNTKNAVGAFRPNDAKGVSMPSTQAWDITKRVIDGKLRSLYDPITGKFKKPHLATSLKSLSEDLRTALRDANPDYRAATDKASDYLRMDEAFRDGGKFFKNSNINEKQFTRRFNKMSDADKEAFRGGISNEFFSLAQKGRLRPQMIRSPRVQEKLRIAFGPDAAKKLSDRAEQEAMMMAANRKYTTGSPTFEFADEAAEQTGKMMKNLATAAKIAKSPVMGTLGAGAEWLAGRQAPIFENVKNEAGRMLMLPPKDLQKYLASINKNKTILNKVADKRNPWFSLLGSNTGSLLTGDE